ncbi:hypothetical protein [Mycobacterium sp. DL99]|uniref:hypothetical protein n=1 Tax=Mycobacterium sp. DL99 TaxID=2528957 RepID=UPI001081CED9|nr:hypothetical protein [Mycobacterium sp. DL99]
MRSLLEVMAESAEQAVIWAGGLICDRALEGWAVVVWLPELAATPALEIVGAQTRVCALDAEMTGAGAPLVRISQAGAPRIQTYVCDVPASDGPPSEGICLVSADSAFQHRLSGAARAFKAQALNACGSPADVGKTEAFRPADRGWVARPAVAATPVG